MPGIARLYYSRDLPAAAVPISRVHVRPAKPSDLVDISNFELSGVYANLGRGELKITSYPGSPSSPFWVAPSLWVPVAITGSSEYKLTNQFFEITHKSDGNGNPYFYYHPLRVNNLTSIGIQSDSGRDAGNFRVEGNRVYHSLDSGLYWIRYSADGVIYTELLRYIPAMTRKTNPGFESYSFNIGGLLSVFLGSATFWVRFTDWNGWRVLAPYSAPLNDPWYVRIRFSLNPPSKEYATQRFYPRRPYMFGSWIPGYPLGKNVIEFERKGIWFDGRTYPDVLIYSKDYKIKYALDGSPPGSRVDKGYLYNWMRNQFISIDEKNARVHVAVDLDPDDICFGFYNYTEPDVVYTKIDINPFTNPAVKNRIIEFYYADRTV